MNERLQHAIKWSLARKTKREKDANPKAGWIYLIKCHEFYKVGIADDVKARLSSMQTGCPYPLELIEAWRSNNASKEEKAIHALLSRYNVRGEWFMLPPELVSQLLRQKP